VGGTGATSSAKGSRATNQPYEFGGFDLPPRRGSTMVNAMVEGWQPAAAISAKHLVIHHTQQSRGARSWSWIWQFDVMTGTINCKRMAIALDGLIRREYPGDYLRFIEMYTFAKVRRAADVIDLMPKPVTLFQPSVQLKVDMSRENVSEHMVHPHFTNMQHALRLSRQLLAAQDAANKQIIVITDGLPTAHFDQNDLYLLYPPHPATEQATIREALLCQREGVTINLFLIPSWSQSEDDIRFAYRLAESAQGRVIFTSGNDLDRFVIWDYVKHKRELIG
jgi:uncharacterized protein with von Willebrand factor type A (vWA) domain